MKLFENIKEFFFSADDDDLDQDDVPVRHERSYQPSDNDESTSNDSGNSNGRRNKVVNIQTTAQLQVVLVKPSAFTDAKQIADHLIAKKTVVLNLETTNKDVARRLVDFLSGCAYALDGKIKKIAVSTYLVTPYNVDVVNTVVEEQETPQETYF